MLCDMPQTGNDIPAFIVSIQSLMNLPHEGDYLDFAGITQEEASGAVETAQLIIDLMRDGLNRMIEEAH